MDNEPNTDVIDNPTPVVEAPESEGAASAPAGVQGEKAPVEEAAGQAEAAFKVPENDDDLKGRENDPQVLPIIQMRRELRERDQRLDSYKQFDEWKPIVETIGNPQLAQSAHELVSAIHTPSQDFQNYPGGYDPTPFLQKIDQESPGTAATMFSALLRFPDVDPQGKPSTVVREFLRDVGLDPDRMADYREIDKLRAGSGVVTAEQLAKIPEQYHEAFRNLSREAQEDLLALRDSSPALAEEHLRNAQRALASESFERQQLERQQQQEQADELAFQQQVETAVGQDIQSEIDSIVDSIHQSLSDFTFSSDPVANEQLREGIVLTIAGLQHPAYRARAEKALKAVGASLDGIDELMNHWAERRSAFTTFSQSDKAHRADMWQAKRAESDATLARQKLLVRLQDYAFRLAKVTGQRGAAAAAQVETALSAASGRFVPAGNGNGAQGGFNNPYAQNPHQVGTQEYYAFNRKVDQQFKLDNASVFGS